MNIASESNCKSLSGVEVQPQAENRGHMILNGAENLDRI